MTEKKHENQKELITSIAVVVILYIILESIGITCPIKFITGISCAGCGMSRAWIALFHKDISSAFYYHPLFWLPPVMLLIFVNKNRININIYKVIMSAGIILFIIIYLCRMIAGNNNIVVFEPQNNIIIKIIKNIN